MIANIAKLIIQLTALSIFSYTDLKEGRIPNLIVLPLILVGFAFSVADKTLNLAMVAGFGLYLVIGFLKLMGMGDIKVFMMINAFMGLKFSLVTLFLASVFLIIYAFIAYHKESVNQTKKLVLQAVNKRVEIDKNHKYPFAVFILAGFVVVCISKLVL